ncbi:MAG: ubiquinone/menaquinone biosynthesis methyltransferase [Acidimicrobiia bacterium]|nr:MAG: ubiquinone/menaquinone biosynthesis methyltransferase [Acidimicrobiia bacterium]
MAIDESAATPAQAYQAYFGPAIFAPLAEKVVARAGPARGARALDVACGTGILTRRIATEVGRGGTVVGVDVNPAMLDMARSFPADPGAAPIEYHEADACTLGLPDASFDVCYCQQGLQFFADRPAAVRAQRCSLRDGGTAVIAVWQGLDRHPLYAALADAEEPHLARLGVEVTRTELEAPFSFGDPQELRSLLLDAGFGHVDVWTDVVEARFPHAESFVARMEFAYAAVVPVFAQDPLLFDGYLAAITDATRAVVDEYRAGDEIVVPMHTNIAVAR